MPRTRLSAVAAAALAVLALAAPAAASTSSLSTVANQILAQPYQPDYVPLGNDAAWQPPNPPLANVHPTDDYTSGSSAV